MGHSGSYLTPLICYYETRSVVVLVPVSSFRFLNPTPMPSQAVMGPVTLQGVDDVFASVDRLESLVAKLTFGELQSAG